MDIQYGVSDLNHKYIKGPNYDYKKPLIGIGPHMQYSPDLNRDY